MARYIDTAKFKIALLNDYAKRIKTGRPFTYDGVEAVIDFGVPDADVQEVKHANWIVDPDEGIARCSSCLNEFEDNGDTIPDYWYYCPNCDAKMDGGKADETRTDL